MSPSESLKTSGPQPIVYSNTVTVCFSHLDRYGHVNSKHYMDYVATSRLNYLKKNFDIDLDQLEKKGLGFYLVDAQQRFLKPITGLTDVFVRSHVESEFDGVLTVKYEIKDSSENLLHSRGTLKYVVIDMETQKKIATPNWMLNYFFKNS